MVEAENVAGSGPYRGTQSLEATTSLTLPIELGGKRSARIAVADARTDRATIQATIAQADLRLNVIRAYAEAASAERRSEEHTSELQSLMRISYAVFCLKKNNKHTTYTQ